MKDNTRRADRAVPATVQAGVPSPGGRNEELTSLFRSLFETSSAACEQASAGDFSGLQDHLRARKRMLERIRELMPGKREDFLPIYNEAKNRLRAVMQSTQEKNLHILQLILGRKKSVLNKIVEVQNTRHVFDYLR